MLPAARPVQKPGGAVDPAPAGSGSHLQRCSCPGFEWRGFEAALEPEFRSVLQATYAGSLDMPELEGARALDDILESHRAAGRFVAERWQLGRVIGEPEAAAVLLLAEVPGRNVWEVIYLGLTPAARGRGLGRAVRRACARPGTWPCPLARAGRRSAQHTGHAALPDYRLHCS